MRSLSASVARPPGAGIRSAGIRARAPVKIHSRQGRRHDTYSDAAIGAFGFLFLIVTLFVGECFGAGHLKETQTADLRKVAARLRETLPDVTVEACFARLEGKDPERVVFEPV